MLLACRCGLSYLITTFFPLNIVKRRHPWSKPTTSRSLQYFYPLLCQNSPCQDRSILSILPPPLPDETACTLPFNQSCYQAHIPLPPYSSSLSITISSPHQPAPHIHHTSNCPNAHTHPHGFPKARPLLRFHAVRMQALWLILLPPRTNNHQMLLSSQLFGRFLDGQDHPGQRPRCHCSSVHQ